MGTTLIPTSARGALHEVFAAAQRRGRKIVAAAGKSILIVVAAADSDELIDLVVVRRDVLVADRPRDFPTIAFRSGEIEVASSASSTRPQMLVLPPRPQTRVSVKVLPERSDVGCSAGSRTNGGGFWPASKRCCRSQGLTCVQNSRRSNLRPASSMVTFMPLRVRFQAAMPPAAPLPMIMTS